MDLAPHTSPHTSPAEDLLEDGRPKSTASVGGRWVAPQEVDKLEKNTPSVGRRRELT